jgi:Holliday junction resolvasome RuvABC endonuclease subunit
MKDKKGLPKLDESVDSFLTIDPSADHLAYVFIGLDHRNKTVNFESVGMIWSKSTWTKGQRFQYINKALDTLINGNYISIPKHIITEQYFMNPKLKSGAAVIPVINGLIEKACAEYGDISYSEVPPPTWRSKLNIKAIRDSNDKRDYKTPTKDMVERFIDVPNEIKSNITLNNKSTPHDIFDALAIAIAVCLDNGFIKFEVLNACFNNFTLIDKLNKIAKEIGHVKKGKKSTN